MPGFKIVSDSSCDIPQDLLRRFDIHTVPYSVSLDGETYYRENIDVTLDDFYQALTTQDIMPRTSLPSIQSYAEVFKKYLEQGEDILCFTLTAKFSGSHQSAVNAAKLMKEEYPGRRIIIRDSYNCTMGQGALVLEAARMRNAGFTLDKTDEICEKIKIHTKIYCTVDSLVYLQKGGRIGKVSALAGGILNIKPVIIMTDGELFPYSKVRGRKRALKEMVRLFHGDLQENPGQFRKYIIQAACPEDHSQMKNTLENEYGYEIDYPLVQLGVTIGAHIGPTVLGIGYTEKYEKYV